MSYFMLYTRDDEGVWSPQFGDRDRECVEFERDDYRDGWQAVKAKDLKIVKFPRVPTNAQIEARTAELNA